MITILCKSQTKIYFFGSSDTSTITDIREEEEEDGDDEDEEAERTPPQQSTPRSPRYGDGHHGLKEDLMKSRPPPSKGIVSIQWRLNKCSVY